MNSVKYENMSYQVPAYYLIICSLHEAAFWLLGIYNYQVYGFSCDQVVL